MKDIITSTSTQNSIENLSPEDFIVYRVNKMVIEIANLKDKYTTLTGNPFPGSEEQDQETEIPGVVMPTKRELIKNVEKFIQLHPTNFFKTSAVFEFFHRDKMNDKKLREELIRRYSNILGQKKKDGEIFSRRVEGERGDIYNTDEQMLIDQYDI